MEYRIKQAPEDFIVRENLDLPLGTGRYAYYRLSKRGWTTQAAVDQVARAFRKRPRFVNFSGNKDRHALTEQYISILHGPRRGLELHGGDIALEYLGQGRERLNLGTSIGNEFRITVRNLPRNSRPRAISQFPNYFDEQRFGMNLNNHIVGKSLILKDFRRACEIVPETGDWLGKSPRDYVGALRSLPRRSLRLFAHAYQSWLWNQTACSCLEGFPHRTVPWPLGELVLPEKPIKNIRVPLLGYDSEIPRGLDGMVQGILRHEGTTFEDFRVRQFREFDLAGGFRDLMAEPGNLEIGPLEDDELSPGRGKCLVGFSLQSGGYATMAIRAIFS
jgi:tRNA(Glu) U13 pseudouridine synthase TruD